MYKFISILLVVTSTLVSKTYAQCSIGIVGGLGTSYITNRSAGQQNLVEKFYPRMSYEIGLELNKKIHKNINLVTSLNFMTLNGKESSRLDDVDDNNKLNGNFGLDTVWLKLNYISFPIMVEYKFRKTSISVGVQNNFRVSGQGVERGYFKTDFQEIRFENKTNKTNAIDNFDFGIVLFFKYYLKNRISIGSKLYYGLNNNWKDYSNSPRLSNNQLLIKVNYDLFKINRKSKNK